MKKNYFLNGFIMAVMLIMTGNMLATGQVILYEDFENGGDLPTNWTQIYEDGDNAWYAQDGDNGSLSAYAGDYNAAFTHETTGDVTKLITPSLDLSSEASLSADKAGNLPDVYRTPMIVKLKNDEL